MAAAKLTVTLLLSVFSAPKFSIYRWLEVDPLQLEQLLPPHLPLRGLQDMQLLLMPVLGRLLRPLTLLNRRRELP